MAMVENTDAFSFDRLTVASQVFAQQLLARFPAVRCGCRMERAAWDGGLHLAVEIPSEVGSDRSIHIWMEEGDEPSLAFGDAGWHTHGAHYRELEEGRYEEESLLDLLDAILHDRFVLLDEPQAEPPVRGLVLDLRNPDALEEELSSPYCSRCVRIRSFSGRADRVVDVDDLDPGGAAP